MNGLHKIYANYRLRRTIPMLAMSFLMVSGLLSSVSFSAGEITTSVTSTVCALYNTVHDVIFFLGLALMIAGAALYAGSTVMPATQKGQVQGYGMGMIMGGIIGVIIALASPFILQIISGSTSLAASCAGYGTF